MEKRKQRVIDQDTIQQFNGREGETATLLSSCPLNSELCGGGCAPRLLKRWAAQWVCYQNS